MRVTFSWKTRALSCLAATLLAGCSGAEAVLPELVPVTGVVTKGGQPVAGAVVTFEPQREGSLSVGATDATGHFELTYLREYKGAVPGPHLVRISKMEGEAGAELIPAKFNEKSKVTCEVTATAPNEFQFEI
jgi:hypothetical protein